MEGHSSNFIRVSAHAREPRWNRVDHVRLTGLATDIMEGEITPVGGSLAPIAFADG
jgi:hypothetical protein